MGLTSIIKLPPPCNVFNKLDESLTMFVLQQQQNLGQKSGASKMHFALPTPVAWAAVHSKAVVLLLLIVTSIVRFCGCSKFCFVFYALLCVHSSFAIILLGKRELVALLCLSFWCLVIVV